MFAAVNLGTELRRFRRSRLGKLAIIAICLIPLLYSTLYLWSFWDPFGKLGRVPVAFVNNDQGTVLSGKPFNAGEQIENKIRHNDQLSWIPTDEHDATTGVHKGKYYFAVILPKDFTEDVVSPTGDKPRKATVYTHYNDSNGWLASLIGQNAMRVFLETVSSEIGQQAIDKVLVAIQDAGKGITKATVGAKQLADGAVQVNDGTVKLQEASAKLDDGAGRLSAGSDKLAAGTQQMHDQLYAFIGKLTGMTSQVHDYHRKAQKISEVQGTTSQELRKTVAILRRSHAPAVLAEADRIDKLATRLDTEGAGPHSKLMKQLNEIDAAATDLDHGKMPAKLTKLTDGVNQLNNGAHELSTGLHTLHNGTGQLVTGVNQLHDGSTRLSNGANELHTKLAEGSKAIPTWTEDHRKSIAKTLAEPVQLSDQRDSRERTFGGGLAPFFFCLALYIGGIIAFLLLRPIHARAVASGINPVRAALNGFTPAAIIALIQALVIVLVTNASVPLEPYTMVGLVFFTMLVGLVFMAMNQMLVALLGPGPGRVATMALLMIQILASGGLYPVETEPSMWEWLHPILPMSYAVNGFRQTLYGDFDGRMIEAVVMLFVFLALNICLTALGARRDRNWNMEKLHPSINI